ncbi:MAG: hypothetical protein ABSE46_09415 [Terracidiphilus sp.]|jgi:hypothetical protein
MSKTSAMMQKTDILRHGLLNRICNRNFQAEQKKGNQLSALAKRLLLVCFVFASAVALPAAAHGEVSIWLQSPKPGANANTVLVYATATTTSGLTGWIIYVDDAIAYRTGDPSTTLSHSLWLSNGTHIVYARAWSYDGFGTSATEVVQVGPPPASSTVLPTPPSNATVLSEIQNTGDGWTDCSLCAEGTNDTTDFWMDPHQSSPSMSGSSLQLFADGLPWTNTLFIKTMPGTNNATHFLWDFWVYHDPTSIANIWSSEFDFWQSLGGKEYMVGSQCDFGDGYWDTWDSANNRWITNGVACPRWAANTWHHVQWYVERINATQYRYDTLVVDGKGYGFNQVWGVNPTSWSNATGIQWQLDQGENGAPVHEWIDNVKLTMW